MNSLNEGYQTVPIQWDKEEESVFFACEAYAIAETSMGYMFGEIADLEADCQAT